MAKFNIEVELDWMDEEAYSIDDELRERIVEGVENALLEKATNEAVKAVDNKIAEKILNTWERDLNCSLRKRDMTGTAALQVIPVTGNYPPPVCSRVSIWKRNLERRLKS